MKQAERIIQSLIPIEIDIIKLVCKELTTLEIAERINKKYRQNYSARTIEGRRARIIKKIGCKGAIGIVLFALRNGLSK